MYLIEETISSQQLQFAVSSSPYNKDAIDCYLLVYRSAKTFLHPLIFGEIRQKIEAMLQTTLNLKKSLERAKFGYFIAIAELTHRQELPEGVTPMSLLSEESSFESKSKNTVETEATASKETSDASNRYWQQLKEYEAFCRFLLVGKVLPNPVETNGVEEAPLLQVFGGARSLQEVHTAYKSLRKAWHPDISPFSEAEANARFHWLKQAYTMLTQHWNRFDPQNPDLPADRIEKLKGQQLQWKPQSFWYWHRGATL